MESHTVLHSSTPPHTHSYWFVHIPLLRPSTSNQFCSHKEGNSSDRQPSSLLSDSNLTPNSLNKKGIQQLRLQDWYIKAVYVWLNLRRKWRNCEASLSFSSRGSSPKVKSRNRSSALPSAHSCHARSCCLHELLLYGFRLQMPWLSSSKTLPHEYETQSTLPSPLALISEQFNCTEVNGALLSKVSCTHMYTVNRYIQLHKLAFLYINTIICSRYSTML